MASYGVMCKIEGSVTFHIQADSLEQALELGRWKAQKMCPFVKELDWIDGHLEVDGVHEND